MRLPGGSGFQHTSKSPGGLVKPHRRASCLEFLIQSGIGPVICSSNKRPGGAYAAGLEAHFEKHQPKETCSERRGLRVGIGAVPSLRRK